jgi:hypothetical protein
MRPHLLVIARTRCVTDLRTGLSLSINQGLEAVDVELFDRH